MKRDDGRDDVEFWWQHGARGGEERVHERVDEEVKVELGGLS